MRGCCIYWAYRLRMRIEELFKDGKTSFALESCQCQRMDTITHLGLFAVLAFWALALLVRYPQGWIRYITARGKLSFLAVALEWLDAPLQVRTTVRQEARSGSPSDGLSGSKKAERPRGALRFRTQSACA
jgi:hypothetical protein